MEGGREEGRERREGEKGGRGERERREGEEGERERKGEEWRRQREEGEANTHSYLCKLEQNLVTPFWVYCHN